MKSMTQTGLALLFFMATASASAQVTESITVNYVEVPVSVVDRGGNAIRGLTAANFEIVDEGKKRPIAGFDAVDFAAVDAAPATMTPAARRNFLLVFDLSFSSPAAVTRAQTAAREFVTKLAGRQDRIGVASVDAAHGFRLLTSFTTDRSLVDAAIGNPLGFSASDPLQVAGASIDARVAESMNAPAAAVGRFQSRNGNEAAAPEEMNAEVLLGMDRQQQAYNRGNVDREVNLLAGLAKIMRVVRGQKHMVLLSEGFDPKVIQGRDAGVTKDQLAESAAIEKGELWNVDNDTRYGSSSSMTIVSRLAEVAKRCDVILDAIDTHGVRTNVDASAGFVKSSNEGLHLLANATGGTVFQNTNSMAENFARALKSQEVVYVIGFQAPVSDPGKFHNLKVKLVNVPGGRAVARSGYYEAGATSAAERTLSDAEIIINDIAQDGVKVSALAAPFATTGANAQVPVILEIKGSDLAEATDPNMTLEIFTYAFDMDGKVRDSLFQRVGIDLSKVGATLRESGVKYYETLSLPPGAYAIKSLVRVGESEKKGFVRTDLVVPAKNDLAVSQPLFVEKGMKWVMIRGGSHDTTGAAYPFEVDGDSFIPSVRVRTGEPRRFVVFVQNAWPDELTIATQPEAKVVSKVRGPAGSKVMFELPGVSAPTLQVSVRKKGSDKEQTASVALVP
jgi:VWFA-related protein